MADNSFPELDTPRLRLRELQHADAEALLAIHGDREAMQLWGVTPSADLPAVHDFIARCRAGRALPIPFLRWAIERKQDQALLGTCGLFNWNPPWEKCMLGYELGRTAWKQGFMGEALRVVIPWGFSHWKLHRIEALIEPANQPSLRLAERLGFKVEGRLREVAKWSEARHDMMQLSLLKHEFDSTIS
ncbi:GNAT family N-acetyltransferase [Ottowia testudinis]|uniref:GNAT family N-acetyltransferase n=1 Tax=Ottowia testudinis TaxID=2816950 RepID=A0A975CGX5_9BURK|nr:GNAT family protein [Ottowia testudinis]QTD45591.1 GNAT family N-acetyltransferase [Ottowia testudinis]